MKLSMVLFAIMIFAIGSSAAAFSQTDGASTQESGKEIFTHKCVTCHGSAGAGTPVGKSLKVADLRSVLVQKKSDADLSHVISEGKNSMPAFGNDLSPEEVKAMVSYVRTLKTKKK
jgi:mono/diheme cytochrome c family protein